MEGIVSLFEYFTSARFSVSSEAEAKAEFNSVWEKG